jgi:hypothetical protein
LYIYVAVCLGGWFGAGLGKAGLVHWLRDLQARVANMYRPESQA